MVKLATKALILAMIVVLTVHGQDALKVLVIKGEDSVNVIQRKTAVAPIVEVRDRNNLPVPGAVVTFAIEGGKAATFAGGASTLTVTTNAAGQAVAAGINPVLSGAVQINVQAAFQGQIAAATIAQTNVLTAAEAATAGATGSAGTGTTAGAAGGGGGLSGTTIGIAAAAVGAGAAAATALGGGESTKAPAVTVTPTGTGIRDVTEYAFTASGDAADFSWNFGDGTTGSGASVRHIYTQEGTFEARASGGGSSAAVTVTIGSLNGTWLRAQVGGVQHRLIVVQQGNRLTGQWWVEFLPGSQFGQPQDTAFTELVGTVSSPRNVRLEQSGECRRLIESGTVNGDLKSMGGNGVYLNTLCGATGASSGDFTFLRQ